MTDKMLPIAFSPAMVQRILAREKSQTRRLFTPPKGYLWEGKFDGLWPVVRLAADALVHTCARCKFGKPGQLLWLQEGIQKTAMNVACYTTDGEVVMVDGKALSWRWKVSGLPSRYCPREASRLTLRTKWIRMEKLQLINEEGARAEGLVSEGEMLKETLKRLSHLRGADAVRALPSGRLSTAREAFALAWDVLHPKHPWNSNPWVWAVGFEEVERR